MRRPLIAGSAAALVILGSALALLAPGFDDGAVRAWHAAARGTSFAGVAHEVTALGSHALLIALMLVTAIIASAARRPRVAVAAVVQVLGAIALNAGIKALVQRPRPDLGELLEVASTSFPSGHALLAAAAWPWLGALLAAREPMARARIWYPLAGLLIAALVAVSRVVLGRHRPSEVLAGLGFGLGWGWLCARWATRPVGAGRL